MGTTNYKTNEMKRILISLLLLYTIASFAQHEFEVSSLFSSQMVIQSGKAFSINGNGTARDKIDIRIDTQNKTIKKQVKVDKHGEWSVNFPPLPAHTTCSITFSNKNTTITYDGIKTGDVWLIIGGSNTVHLLGNADLFEHEKTKNDSLQFNYIVIPKGSALSPQKLTEKTEWKKNTQQNLSKTPSIAYYMGQTLASSVDIPIGIINCGFGGSIVETWTAASDLNFTNENLTAHNQNLKQTHTAQVIRAFENKFPYQVKINQVNEDRSSYSSPSFDDSTWEETLIPETFNYKGLEDFDGVVWFRKQIEIPLGVKINKISMGYVDDSDEVYINGHFVGGIEDGYGIARIYDIPESILKSGKNTIAVRVRDIGGGGGLYGKNESYFMSGDAISINIAGQWKYRVESIETDVDMNDIKRPGMLFNQMISPLSNFPIKGIVWYQGEVEALSETNFDNYQVKLKALISGYRREFKEEQLPFIIVQLPSHGDNEMINLSSWVDFKYSQETVAKGDSNVEIVSITDLINHKNNLDIHLSNHKATGERVAKIALKKVYQSSDGAMCPCISTHNIENNSIILSFNHAQELKSTDEYGYIKGFQLISNSNAFSNVQAQIMDKNKVVIQFNDDSAFIQYCGQVNSTAGNLVNESEMPVIPFRISLKQ